MPARLLRFAVVLIAAGCAQAADTKPAPQPEPAPAQPAPPPPKADPPANSPADKAAEDRLVKYMEKVGGRVWRDNFGQGYIISAVYLLGAKATDEGIREVLLPTLHSIDFGETPVTDATLEKIRSMQQLGTLTVSSPKVTDAGLAHIAQAKSLISVNLTGCSQVTKEGVKQLAALPELIDVMLTGTKVTDEDVQELKKLMPKCHIFKGRP